MARIRDFEDPAEEDYERVLSEQRDREERADRAGRREPWPVRGYELVRVSPELIEELMQHESEPVVVMKVDRQNDGTLELILRKFDPAPQED